MHSSFVARYKTVVATYFDEVDQFGGTKGKPFRKGVSKEGSFTQDKHSASTKQVKQKHI